VGLDITLSVAKEKTSTENQRLKDPITMSNVRKCVFTSVKLTSALL